MTQATHVLIRPTTIDDAPTIAYHRRRMFEDMGGFDPAGVALQEQNFIPWVRDKLVSGIYQGRFAVDGDVVVAGAGLWVMDWPPGPLDPDGRRAYIFNVFTEPAYRRRGLARRLMESLLDWARENGVTSVGLHASDAGRGLYESMGFGQTNEMRVMIGR